MCYISGAEGRSKLKFGEVGLQTCENFLRKNRAKKFPTECPFDTNKKKVPTRTNRININANHGNKSGLI